MEVDAQLLKDVIVNLLLEFKHLHQELRAYQALFWMLNDAYPEEHLQEKLEKLVETYSAPALEREMRDRYDAPRERLLKECDQLGLERAVGAFLESLNPKREQTDEHLS